MAEKSDPAPDTAPTIGSSPTDLSKMPAAEFKALLKQTLRLAEEGRRRSGPSPATGSSAFSGPQGQMPSGGRQAGPAEP